MYATEDDFISMTRDTLLQSCIYLLDQHINTSMEKPPGLDQTIIPKDIVATELETQYFNELMRHYLHE